MPIVGGQPACQFPDPLDRIEFGTVWGQEQKRKHLASLVQPRLQRASVVVLGVVQYQDKPLASGTVFEESFQKPQEGLAIEWRLECCDQRAGVSVDRPEARHGLARGRMQQNGVFVFRRNPHTTASTVLLEVAFARTP